MMKCQTADKKVAFNVYSDMPRVVFSELNVIFSTYILERTKRKVEKKQVWPQF